MRTLDQTLKGVTDSMIWEMRNNTMKQYDSMFIQRNETGDIYHLCYTDNSRDTISRARFTELLPMTKYEADDGVYWFRSNFWPFAQTPQDSPISHDAEKVTLSHHIDGYVETDAAWLANQDKLDFDATMDAASYRGQ